MKIVINSWTDIENFLSLSHRIFLYGAGEVSNIISLRLDNDNIAGYIVSDIAKVGREFCGHTVYQVGDEAISRDSSILVAVGKNYRDEIVGTLKKYGYENIAVLSDRFSELLLGEKRLQVRPEKYRVMIETSSICNARCSFCPNVTLKRKHMVMPDDIFSCILSRIETEKIPVERFILHLNGEPFTDRKLCLRIKEIKKRFHDIPVWFTTNFALPDHQMIEDLLASGADQITISLNTVDKDEYHDITGGLDFDRTISNLDYLLSRLHENMSSCLKVRLSIVDTGNPDKVEAFKKRFADLAEIRVMRLGQWMGSAPSEQMKKNSRNCQVLCEDLRSQICILSNGDFAFCDFDAEGHVGINVLDMPILEAYYSKKFMDLREQHVYKGRKGSLCENCSYSY